MNLVLEKMGKINLFEKHCLRKGKLMKKIKKLFICALMVCVLFGCSSPVQPTPVPFEKKLAGQYNLYAGDDLREFKFEYYFNEDGTGDVIMSMNGVTGKPTSAKWEKTNNQTIVVTTEDGSDFTFTYIESEDSIALNYKGIELVKQ